MQKANPSLFCTSKYLQPSSLQPSEGHSIPSCHPRAPRRGRGSWCPVSWRVAEPQRAQCCQTGGLRWTLAWGFVHPFSLPLGTGKRVPPTPALEYGRQRVPATKR